jgi:Carboxypeptidase regulatory-like domain/TonB dependent receptor
MRNRVVFFSVALVLLAAVMPAQETRGTILGRVSDPSGAVIPGATVVVSNPATGTKTTLQTNADGYYQATFLLPGQYQMEVSSGGFKTSLRDHVLVQVGDRLEVNFALEVGASEVSVTVTSEAPPLNTESASIGSVVDARRVADLPLTYGNPFGLIGLAGGVAFTGDPRLDRPFEPTHIVGFAMGGSRGNLSDVTLDGAPTTATANGNQVIASYVPPTDIVQEFKVQTATFDAQFGQTQGGVTNISLKSGTNEFHGTAYYSFYRKDFSANDFFNNLQGRDRPDFHFDRWGGSFGGPVRIPKVYDGRSKTFFMWGYEGLRDSRPRYDSSTNTVPSPAMLGGDFSSLLAVGSSYAIYDPATRVAAAGGRYQETPFPGNLVPQARFNAIARNIAKYFPAPTSTPKADGTANLIEPDLAEKAKYRNHTWRVDQNMSERHRIFVRASLYDRYSTYNNYFNNVATGVTFEFVSRAAVIDDVYTLTPTMVLNTRYSYNRFIRFQDQNEAATGFDLTTLGFPSSYESLIPADVRRFPQINMTGYIPTGSTSGENRPVNNHTISETLTKALGTHSIRSGVEFRAYQETDKFFGYQQTGTFNFDSTWTRGPLDNSATAPGSLGQSVAAFLLGLPSSSSSVQRTADYAEQSNSWGVFVQDDWKVSRKLTLNLGLRWEFEQPLHERYNKSVLGFDFGYTQPFSATAAANYAKSDASLIPEIGAISAKGGLTFAGVSGNPTGLYNTPKNGFLPRIGLAYQVDPHTVLRTGFGMFQGFLGERRGDVIQSGWSQTTNMVPTTDNGLNFIATLSNPFPNAIQEPVGATGGYQTFLGQNISFFNQNPKVPRVFRWELGLQRELKGGVVFGLDYVGNKTYHIEISRNLNALPDQYLSRSPFRDNTTNSYLTATVPNPFVGLVTNNSTSVFTSSSVARQSLMLPYPEFGTITGTTNEGYSWYHSLQISLERRFAKGFTISGNYTYSKFMQAINLLNAADIQPVREISDQDTPDRFTMSGIVELPFGRNKPWIHTANPVASRLVGGWQISGLMSYQTGFPIAWGNYIALDPSQILLPADQRTTAHYFNTKAFDVNSNDALVSNVRTFPLRFSQIRQPSPWNVDLSLIKNTHITERKQIQFRAEGLNVLNHPVLSSNNTNNIITSPTSATFGQIVGSTQAGYPRRIQLTLKYIF